MSQPPVPLPAARSQATLRTSVRIFDTSGAGSGSTASELLLSGGVVQGLERGLPANRDNFVEIACADKGLVPHRTVGQTQGPAYRSHTRACLRGRINFNCRRLGAERQTGVW